MHWTNRLANAASVASAGPLWLMKGRNGKTLLIKSFFTPEKTKHRKSIRTSIRNPYLCGQKPKI